MARQRERDKKDILAALKKLSSANSIGARERAASAEGHELGPDVSLIRNVAVLPIFAFNRLLLF